jgi:hypothetical protein
MYHSLLPTINLLGITVVFNITFRGYLTHVTMENITQQFDSMNFGERPSPIFFDELQYIISTVVNIYNTDKYIYTDVLDILAHKGQDVCDNGDESLEKDEQWFNKYGRFYVYNTICSYIDCSIEDITQIFILIDNIKTIYGMIDLLQ